MGQTARRVVVLGGGFAGLFAILHLWHQGFTDGVTLVDPQAGFVFKPLLYELLSGEMSNNQVWPRYEDLLRNSQVRFVQDSAESVDLEGQVVRMASGTCYGYDYLVLAVGSTTGYFGVPGAAEHTFAFRTGEDVYALMAHLRRCLQQASQSSDPEARQALLSVGVVGAGPTGVELSATLGDLLPEWYHYLKGNVGEIRIALLNRGKDILAGDINGRLRATARESLEHRTVGVQLIDQAAVTAVHPDRIEYQRAGVAGVLNAATRIWTAGTATHPLISGLSITAEQRDNRGRLVVAPTLQLPDYPEVFAAGDCAVDYEPVSRNGHREDYEKHEADAHRGQDYRSRPATAQVAYQQGAAIAHNIAALVRGERPVPARVALRGTLMKLGLYESAAEIFDRFEVKGHTGHLIRQGAYLELLPTPAHNLKVTAEWLVDELFHRYHPLSSRD